MCTCEQHASRQTGKQASKQKASSSNNTTTTTQRNGHAAQQGPECLGLGLFLLLESLASSKSSSKCFSCTLCATLNEVGLCLLKELLRCVSLSCRVSLEHCLLGEEEWCLRRFSVVLYGVVASG